MLELNKIYNEDCLEGMKRIEDGSIDMILCDLPYGTTQCKWDNIIPFDSLWEQYKRIIKVNGAIVLMAGQPFTSALVMSNPKLFRYEWIWEKHKGTNFYQAKTAPMKIHESVLVFSKEKVDYFPQMTDGDIYTKRSSKHKLPKDHVMTPGKSIGYSKTLDTSKRYPVSIQYYSNHNQKENRLHPTQKPVSLFEYLVKTYTNENEIVLDNCMGSGTTAIACLNTNRNYIGFELDKEYYQSATERILNHKEKELV